MKKDKKEYLKPYASRHNLEKLKEFTTTYKE